MEPQYRFCTSADGTRIAYATYGRGPPLFFANTWVLSMDAQFTWPDARVFFDALAARTTLVIFDRRGTGASAREVEDISPEAEACDIAAVADAAGLGDIPLFADATAGAACAAYASANPDRVQRLVLWFPWASMGGSDQDMERARHFRQDWTYARRVWAGLIFREGPVSLQRACSRAIKNSVSPEMAARRFEAHEQIDALLPAVTQPTLVLQRESLPGPQRQFAMYVAALPPSGQLHFVPGHAATPYPVHEPIVDAVLEFIGSDREASAPRDEPFSSATAIILFADIADSTALTERLGDSAFRAKARDLDESLRAAIREHAGTAIEGKLLGDGVLAVFSSARQAIECALSCRSAGETVGLELHLGLHAGDVLREEGNVYGGAVNIASRIADASAPGEVLVSDIVRALARTSAGVTFEDRGEHELKGIADSQRLWAVREGED
jgi:class 3 adenylate cyclase/pimeloyl-ACP methyl ester carboxylesterase